MLPHSSAASNPVRVRFGRFELDVANARLLRDGKPVALAPTPFGVLCALVRQPGALLSKHALLDEVWGHQFVSESVLKTVISELRAVLDDDARRPRFIETVSRRGYRFIAAAIAPPAASSAGASELQSGSLQAPSFIGRAEALARLRHAWDIACSGSAVVWVPANRDRQDHADRALRRGPRRCRRCAWPMRGALRQRRAVSPGSRSPRAAVPERQRRRGLAARRRAGLAAAAAMAQQRGGA